MSAISNIYAKDGFFWWVGVVEDRNDPLKVGRCRVRILGYHLDNKEVLPTSELPWAMPMMPVTSASVSGIGNSPTGPVPGSWVIGFFIDGKEKQQPMIMGTIAGFPTDRDSCTAQAGDAIASQPGVIKDSSGNVVTDGSGNPITTETTSTATTVSSSSTTATVLAPLTAADLQALKDAIGFKESSSKVGGVQNYATVNTIGYTGKYQFGILALITLGYVRSPVGTKPKNADLNTNSLWIGKNGCSSHADWKANKNNVQEIVMDANLKYNYNILKKGVIDPTGTKGDCAGFLWVAHTLGAGSARQFKAGVEKKDAYGTGASKVYGLGKALFNEDGTVKPTPAATSTQPAANTRQPNPASTPYTDTLNDPALGAPRAFEDPSSMYPRCDYVGRPDTNKLATSDTDGTIVDKKVNNLIDGITVANDDETWDELGPAYAARYPYNHVMESESGHILEIDDTPRKERIHVYHRAGTYVEIDENGSWNQHVQGDNREVFIRNNNIYIKGDWTLTVEGASRVMAKDTLDLEVWGKTTVNIKNDAVVNVSGKADVSVTNDLKVKAKNIYLESEADFHIKSGGGIFVQTTFDVNVKAGGSLNTTAGLKTSVGASKIDVRASGNLSMDGGNIHINSGVAAPTAATAAKPTSLEAPATAKTPDGVKTTALTRVETGAAAESTYANDGGEAPQRREQAIANGEITQEDVSKGDARAAQGCRRSDTNAPKIVASTAYKLGEFAGYKEFPYSIQLSKYYKLGDLANVGSNSASENQTFWSDVRKTSFNGLTKSQLMDNLRGLAVNVLDPIRARYPGVQFTSCMRFSIPKGGSQTSQHLKGQAIDMVFGDLASHYDAALWIRDHVAYDQLLLEYMYKNGKYIGWVHCSFNPAGNRTSGVKVATFVNHSLSKAFLCDLST